MRLSTAAFITLLSAPALPAGAARIVQAAKADGAFTKLLAANDLAGSTAVLGGSGPFTVFAPNDSAFAKLPQAEFSPRGPKDIMGHA